MFKVLVVDDDEELVSAVSELLDRNGYEPVTAFSGIEAIEKYSSYPDINVALVDLVMPMMDGFQAGKVLKRNPDTKDIPIIFLTARKSKGDLQQAILSGGVDYLVKPFRSSDLISRLRKAVGDGE